MVKQSSLESQVQHQPSFRELRHNYTAAHAYHIILLHIAAYTSKMNVQLQKKVNSIAQNNQDENVCSSQEIHYEKL